MHFLVFATNDINKIPTRSLACSDLVEEKFIGPRPVCNFTKRVSFCSVELPTEKKGLFIKIAIDENENSRKFLQTDG